MGRSVALYIIYTPNYRKTLPIELFHLTTPLYPGKSRCRLPAGLVQRSTTPRKFGRTPLGVKLPQKLPKKHPSHLPKGSLVSQGLRRFSRFGPVATARRNAKNPLSPWERRGLRLWVGKGRGPIYIIYPKPLPNPTHLKMDPT